MLEKYFGGLSEEIPGHLRGASFPNFTFATPGLSVWSKFVKPFLDGIAEEFLENTQGTFTGCIKKIVRDFWNS